MPRRPTLSRATASTRRRKVTTTSVGTTVLVFLKAPRPGYVKTRLAATIGGEAANRLYRELAERQLEAIPSHWRSEVCYAPRGARREMVAWLGRRTRLRLQDGDDLGARLTTAFRTAFERGSKRVLAIGADCPDLDAACLNAAANALNDCDAVLGPAKDGGYYLIGMRRNLPRLFEDIAWSSSTVLRTTIERARESKASVRLLVEKEDIDDFDSLQRYRSRERRELNAIVRRGGVVRSSYMLRLRGKERHTPL